MELLAYLFGFYLLDGLVSVARQSSLFYSPLPRMWRVRDGDFIWLDVWPGAAGLRAGRLPVDVTTEGVHYVSPWPTWRSGARTPEVFYEPFDTLGPVTSDGTAIVSGGRVLGRCASAEAAVAASALLERLRGAEPSSRAAAISAFLDESLDRKAAAATIERTRRRTSMLRSLCASQFLVLFACLPVALLLDAPPRTMLALGGIVVVYHALIVGLYARARRLLDSTSPSRLSLMMFYPPAALHAAQELSKNAVSRFHPLAVASVLLSRDRFLEFARRELERTGHPNWLHPHLVGEDVSEDRTAILGVHRAAMLRFLEKSRTPVESLIGARPQGDPAAEGYCPLCLSEYAAGPPSCHGCGVPLRPYAV